MDIRKGLFGIFFVATLFIFLAPLNTIASVDSDGGITGAVKGSVTGKYKKDYLGDYTYSRKLIDKNNTTYNLPSDSHFSPDETIGAEYRCDYYGGTVHAMSNVWCIKTTATTDPDGTTNKTPSGGGASGGASDPSGGTTAGGTTTQKDDQPLTALLQQSASKLPSLLSTKGCGSNGLYTNGILAGLSCSGPTNGPTGLQQVIQVIKNVINTILLPISGVLFTIMVIAGGIIYITSAGNQPRIDLAKKTLTAGVVGLIIVVLAFVIIRIVVSVMGGTIV